MHPAGPPCGTLGSPPAPRCGPSPGRPACSRPRRRGGTSLGIHRRGQGEHHVGRHLAAGEQLGMSERWVWISGSQPACAPGREGPPRNIETGCTWRPSAGRSSRSGAAAASAPPARPASAGAGPTGPPAGWGLAAADGHHDPVAIAHQGDGILHGGPRRAWSSVHDIPDGTGNYLVLCQSALGGGLAAVDQADVLPPSAALTPMITCSRSSVGDGHATCPGHRSGPSPSCPRCCP
jgi:hypothetical protein